MRALTPPRAMGILFTITCFLIFRFLPRHDLLDDSPTMNILSPRQGVSVSVPQNNSPTPSPTETSSSSSSPQEQTSSSSSTEPSATPQPSSTPVSSATEQSTSLTPTTSTPSTNTPASTTPHSVQAPVTSAFLTTDEGGQTITSIVIISDQASSSSTPTQSSPPGSSSGSSDISSSTIIGLSVAGGVAIIGLIGFFVWKFTRKRGNEFNDNEEIKWPELNAHDANVPLPTHRTGGSGIDTTADVRRNSVGYAPSTAANSTAELNPDPYAVPPLPHLNPNQPYHDDPNEQFYDPYRGPVPQTFEGVPGESIPMTQLAGRRSPGPGAAYGVDYVGGRGSPAPQVAYGGGDYGGRASPAPQGAYGPGLGGRSSPAPQGAYGPGVGGRMSPGPGVVYAGRASPAPQAAYGNYGPR